jgi:hypothetical protein
MSEMPETNTDPARPCTCHPDDNPPTPCPKQYALQDCRYVAEIIKLRVEVERLRDAAHKAISRVEPWTTHCDYRAEPNLADAVAILRSALTGREAG